MIIFFYISSIVYNYVVYLGKECLYVHGTFDYKFEVKRKLSFERGGPHSFLSEVNLKNSPFT